VYLEQDGAVGIITINRPEVHNSIDEEAINEFEQILDRLSNSEMVKVIVLTGSGSDSFCSGGDLNYFNKLENQKQVGDMSGRMRSILDRLWNGDIPVIGAINGKAIGGGCEVVTACHIRCASDSSTFAFKHSLIGAFTGWGGGGRLIQHLGRKKALYLLLTS